MKQKYFLVFLFFNLLFNQNNNLKGEFEELEKKKKDHELEPHTETFEENKEQVIVDVIEEPPNLYLNFNTELNNENSRFMPVCIIFSCLFFCFILYIIFSAF